MRNVFASSHANVTFVLFLFILAGVPCSCQWFLLLTPPIVFDTKWSTLVLAGALATRRAYLNLQCVVTCVWLYTSAVLDSLSNTFSISCSCLPAIQPLYCWPNITFFWRWSVELMRSGCQETFSFGLQRSFLLLELLLYYYVWFY